MNNQLISQFPITPHLSEICEKLKNSPSRFLILTAETAAGKSTVLPLALLEQFEGKILMTEPRRLAVLGVANRVAELRNENAGETVGYRIQLETKISNKTRLEVETEGILVRQLQSDPALEEYSVVVIDEFHERSVNTDLALAFLKEAMELRDDLFVIVMSATIDTEKLVTYLGESTEVLKIPGRQFPVEIVYDGESSVEQAIFGELQRGKLQRGKLRQGTGLCGDMLVFLPGIADIRKTQERLVEKNIEEFAEVCILHSSISLEEQKKIIGNKGRNSENLPRVILSSAIAETSVTVPGITCVIDSGLSRINRINVETGMENLLTETESEFSAEQRAGRAGRVGPGKAIRLWSKANIRIRELPPEILRADITALVLECCDRGVYTENGINWLDKPSKAAWTEAIKLLQLLGFIKEDNRITEKGRIALSLGVHPRLAGIAIAGFDYEKKDFSAKAGSILVKYSSYSKSSPDIQLRFLSDLERKIKNIRDRGQVSVIKSQIEKKAIDLSPVLTKEFPVVFAGYPDRVAKRITAIGIEPAEYQFSKGRKAKLYQRPVPEWIIAPEVSAGEREGVINEYEELSKEAVEKIIYPLAQIKIDCFFENGSISKLENLCYGEIVLSSKKIPVESQDQILAWENEVNKKGFDVLPIDEKLEKFLLRTEFYFQQTKCDRGQISVTTSKSDSNDRDLSPVTNLKQQLAENIHQWLPPFMAGQKKLTEEVVYDGLYWFLDGTKIDKQVPELLILSNGRKCKIKYEKLSSPDDKNLLVIRPVLEIIIQRIFGVFATPEICGMKVLLRLLSPASRPLQVTDDLENFWTGAWPQICKEMKGRYPKHNWDYKVVDKSVND